MRLDSIESHILTREIEAVTVIPYSDPFGITKESETQCFLSRDRDPASQEGETLTQKAKGTVSNDFGPGVQKVLHRGPDKFCYPYRVASNLFFFIFILFKFYFFFSTNLLKFFLSYLTNRNLQF